LLAVFSSLSPRDGFLSEGVLLENTVLEGLTRASGKELFHGDESGGAPNDRPKESHEILCPAAILVQLAE
jgi:hypothetical protein